MKKGQKLKLGDAHATPRNIKEVQASKLGDAPEAPLLHQQKIRSPFKTLYFYCFMHYAFFLERLCYCFQFYFLLFAAINGLITSCCSGERLIPFSIAKNTLVFTLIVQRVFSFSATAFSFCFRLDFCSDLLLSLYQGVF
jgi:hypothetical protein